MTSSDLCEMDLYEIIPRKESIYDTGENWIKKYKENYLSSNFKKTIRDTDGNIVFLFGVNSDGWTWIIASDIIKKDPIASMIELESLCSIALAFYPELKRVYTYNDPAWPESILWLRRWGFKEKMVESFEDGKDRVLLVKERSQWEQ